jgi:phosphatidylinositol alpha-mannosyltransferase
MNRPLKIGLVSPYDYAFHGGVTDHISHLATQFRNWGHDVRVIGPCSDVESVADKDFIPMGRTVPVPSGGSIARISFSVWLRPRIEALLKKEAFDIIHLHEPFSSYIPFSVLEVPASVNSVKVATFHTYRGTKLYKFGANRIGMRYFRRLDGRIAVSGPAHQFISSYFPGDYKIIPNGIHVDGFVNARPFPHLQDGKINLLFLGRLEKRKGLRYVLGAFSRLKWDWPQLRLLVVGPGKPDSDSYRIMSERNLKDVVFVGPVSDEDKARYYKSADIYCSPATGRESFGIVLLEAMAAGRPVIASDIEGYSSVITHEKEGLLVPPKKDDALADAIARLLNDHDLRMKLAVNGRERAEEFRWERVAARVMDYYQSLLGVRQAAVSS